MQTILVVDDSPTIRRMVRTALGSLADVTFAEAGSGLQAIETLAVQPVQAIVLDLNMPDMHGLDVLKFLRAYVEALHRVLTDRETALRILAKYTRTEDTEILASTYRHYRSRYLEKIYVDLEGVKNLLRFELKDAGEAAPARFVDNSFVAELEREGMFEKRYR